MSGISLVTKGFISPVSVGGGGGGAVPMYKDENRPKPFIKVIDFIIEGEIKEPLTEEVFKVKSLKIIAEDQKD